jgi:hypothetical protein
LRESLCKEPDELVGIDEFGKCLCARLDEAEHILGCQDGEEKESSVRTIVERKRYPRGYKQ